MIGKLNWRGMKNIVLSHLSWNPESENPSESLINWAKELKSKEN
jgi:hypothetical protein